MAGVKAFFDLKPLAFRMDVPGLEVTEKVTGHGPWSLLDRFLDQKCTLVELQIVMLRGRMGAGRAEDEAMAIIADVVRPDQLEKCRLVCLSIMDEVIGDAAEAEAEIHLEALGKPDPVETPPASSASKTDATTGQKSTASSPKKAKRQRRGKGAATASSSKP